MPHKLDNFILIGIDGGATEVKAHQVHWSTDSADALGKFRLGEVAASRKYEPLHDFTPVPVTEQFAQRDAGVCNLTDTEQAQGKVWVAAAVDSVVEIGTAAGAQKVLIGMGMPGLKTDDGRGVRVINNGPRIPDFLEQLEAGLEANSIELAAPIAALGSDADYCGLGEMHAESGLLRDVENAYYAGAGTGVADAMKLGGRLVPFDEAKPWIQKAWQFPSAIGPTFEQLVSAKSLNLLYHQLTLSRTEAFPEADAATGNATAQAVMRMAAAVLAELLFERLSTIARGRSPMAHRGETYLALETEHPFKGTMLERLIIGQRIGAIYAAPWYRVTFSELLDACLAEMIRESGDEGLSAHYLKGGQLQPGVVQGSTLRAAPAIGAAVAAVEVWRDNTD